MEAFPMRYFTTDTYETKRTLLNFCEKLCTNVSQVESKFVKDMIYGILSSESILISDIAESLSEDIKKINTEERLCRNLKKELSPTIRREFMKLITPLISDAPVVLVDDTDIVKPHGRNFESLGRVKDGSSLKNTTEKGYHATEITLLTKDTKHPISLYSHIYSSAEAGFKSKNTFLYKGLTDVIKSLNTTATFCFDRGFDMNELFKFMYEEKQNFIIRMKENRNVFFKGKCLKAYTLRDSRKGKIKTELFLNGEKRECYISHVNCQITASKRNMYLVLVYGIGETPMMLATNCPIESKEDVIKVLRTYMSRWRIEEHFRYKKVAYGFEDFRVRKLKAINNLNTLLSYALGLVSMLAEKRDRSNLTQLLIKKSESFKEKLLFFNYQISKGIKKVLSAARTGIKAWQNIRYNEHQKQLCFKLAC